MVKLYVVMGVSVCGNVCNLVSSKIQKLSRNHKGYALAHFSKRSLGLKKGISVHRLVLITYKFIPNYKEMTVNHINEIRDDNNLCNLEWLTNAENIVYSQGKAYEFYNTLTGTYIYFPCLNVFCRGTKYDAPNLCNLAKGKLNSHKGLIRVEDVGKYNNG